MNVNPKPSILSDVGIVYRIYEFSGIIFLFLQTSGSNNKTSKLGMEHSEGKGVR